MRQGRRTALAEDTTPGKILVLGLFANAPIFVGMVAVLVITGGNTAAARKFAPAILWATPIFAIACIGIFLRAKPERKSHRASRIGVMLAIVSLVLWVLVLIPTIRG